MARTTFRECHYPHFLQTQEIQRRATMLDAVFAAFQSENSGDIFLYTCAVALLTTFIVK
jgi:hypothetical protein